MNVVYSKGEILYYVEVTYDDPAGHRTGRRDYFHGHGGAAREGSPLVSIAD